MKTMTYRTTFALDSATAKHLKHLSSVWHVSQAEVVRRAVAEADAAILNNKPDSLAMLEELHNSGQGLEPKIAKQWVSEVREDRKKWRGSQ